MKVDTGPDYTDAAQLAQALIEQADAIGAMAPKVAQARRVLEFASDRRKMALAVSFKTAMAAGSASATAAEHYARASQEYGVAIAEQEQQLDTAERAVAAWEAAKCKFEALRTATSLQKSLAQIL